jgi:hypothetical protein
VTDLLPPPAYVPTWGDRARRYRRTVADWCEICERRPRRQILGVWVGRELEVHHRYGRGVVSVVALEADAELITVCANYSDRDRRRIARAKAKRKLKECRVKQPCHVLIHREFGWGKAPYSVDDAHRLAAVTRRVHRAGWWRRVGRRALHLGDLIEPIDGRRL